MQTANPISRKAKGVVSVDPKGLWELFLDTGAPEVYLFYKKAKSESL